MKRNVLVFGLISGLIVTLWMLSFVIFVGPDTDFEGGEIYGYGSMLVAFSFIIVGIKNYRDKYLGGAISFGKAFKTGFLIALLASTVYTVSWLVYYYASGTDFIEVYTACMQKQLVESGASATEIAKQAQEMRQFTEWYQNPLFNALVTYMEILPLGIVVALIGAAILRRKQKPGNTASTEQPSIH